MVDTKRSRKGKRNPLLVLLSELWSNLHERRPVFVLYMVMFFVASLTYLMQPLVIGLVFNEVQETIMTSSDLWRLIGLISLLLVISVVYWLLHGPARIMERRTGYLVGNNFVNKKVAKILALPISWHKDHHSGDTIDKLAKSRGSLQGFASHTTHSLVRASVNLVGSIIVLLVFDPFSAMVAFFCSFGIISVVLYLDRKLVKLYDKRNKLENKASATVFDYIANVVTVVTLRLKGMVKREVKKKLLTPYSVHAQSAKLDEVKWWVISILIDGMIVVLLALSAYRSFHGSGVILVGSLYILYGYLTRMSGTFYNMAWLYGSIVHGATDVDNAKSIDDAYDKLVDRRESKLSSSWQKVDIRGLDFTYNAKGKQNHLENVHFSFSKGEKIALVGESGSGKSTLLSLLRGLYDPDAAHVYVNGSPLKHKLLHIADRVTLIPQDPEIFNDTMRFNITMGASYSQSEVLKAVKLAQFSPVLKRLSKGLSTNVKEKGVSLSGGEKQRLALARGLLAAKDSDIVLLDEPTSSVDSVNELKIHENIFRSFKHKTIVASIHRLHLLSKFDTIYFFDKGKLVAHGTLSELKKIPKFNRLLRKYRNVKK